MQPLEQSASTVTSDSSQTSKVRLISQDCAVELKGMHQPVVNPFINFTRFSTLSVARSVVVAIFLFVPRFVLFCMSLFFLWLFSCIVVLVHGKPKLRSKPLKSRMWNRYMSVCARITMFSLGYVWLKRHGKPASPQDAPIVVSNHCTFVDSLFFIYDLNSSFVAKVELARICVVWTVLQALQCMSVDRLDKRSTSEVTHEIRRRAESGEWQHIVIFPEGTTTNQRALISFKPGAFSPGVPVQPVILHYSFQNLDPSFVGRMHSLKFALLAMTQFTNQLDIHYLPKYIPTAEERENPKLYANNVRKAMSKALEPARSIPVTSHSFQDVKLQLEAQKLHLPQDCCSLELCREFPATTLDVAKSYVRRFARLDRNRDGIITFDDFRHMLATNPDGSMRKLAEDERFVHSVFNLFDVDHDCSISVRDFFIGMSLLNLCEDKNKKIASPSHHQEESNLVIAFGLLDRNADNFITRDELEHAVGLVVHQDPFCFKIPDPLVVSNVDRIMEGCDLNHDGKIDVEEFIAYAVKNEEILVALARAVQLAQ